jgi:DNA-binding SARP family transcriptional activator
MDQLDVRLFGRLNVECAGRTLGSRDFGGIKPRQILEILLLSRGHAVPKDRLADLLWGELLPQNVSGALETYVSVLRRHLCPEGRNGHTVIVTEPEAYRLAADLVNVDLDRFDALLADAANANGNSPRSYLETAVELARGDVLEDEPYADWALPARELYQERRLRALTDAGEAALREADYEAALAHAAAAIQLDSVNEPAYRTMMLAYNALDRPQDAIRTFERCRRELERVLDATPSRATERLHEGIRRHEDQEQLLDNKPRGVTLVAEPPQNGGSRADRLIGRVDELAALEDALATAHSGSLTLTFIEGEPGIGKTRLLEEALARVPEGARVGRVRCTELERTVPYAALAFALREALDGFELELPHRDALGGILPELSLDRVPIADDPRALEALVSAVESLAPLVLVLDDLHHADPSTVTALGYLARRCPDASVAILAAVGTELFGPDDRLYALEPTLRLQLEPLSRRELTAAGLGPLYERTNGHPLIVSALLAGEGALPQKTAEVLLERCRAQGLFAFRLLAAASVLTQPFSPEVLAMVVDAGEARVAEALERLCDRGLLQVQGLCFVFRFQIVADVLHKNLTPFTRTLLANRARSANAANERILRVEAS